jgi:inorganic phosphate transporter, PiT family
MSDVAALPGSIEPAKHKGPNLDGGMHPLTGIIYLAVVAAALLFVAYSIYDDVDATGTRVTSFAPYILLFVALLIALGFEFVNGFHDTANAVATVIYTRSLPANIAVVWSGMFNLFGVLTSTGAVAFGVVSLLPVELILQVGSGAGFAMVFALLISAIMWNVGTWWFGLPASSSHTLIGSIMGVGITNALLRGRDGTSGWTGRRPPISARRCCCRRCLALHWPPCCCSSSRTSCRRLRRRCSLNPRVTRRPQCGSVVS